MKNTKTWEFIKKHYPNAVVDFEYSNGETLFYTCKEAQENMNDTKLYSCCPCKGGYKILTDF